MYLFNFSISDKISFFHRFFDYVNKRDAEAIKKWIDEFVAEDFVNHSPALNVSTDREGLKEMFWKLFKIFPDMTITIKEMAFENDILCFRHIIRGFGTSDEIMGIAMVRYKDGRIVDRWTGKGVKSLSLTIGQIFILDMVGLRRASIQLLS